jgi:DNA polymerase IIIc chi subunit
MSPKVDSQTPAWVLDIVTEQIGRGEQMLIDHMLETGEDVSDTALWIHRRSQFLSLLAQRAMAPR